MIGYTFLWPLLQDDECNRFRLLNVFVGEAKTLQTVDTHQTALNLSSEIQSGARPFCKL